MSDASAMGLGVGVDVGKADKVGSGGVIGRGGGVETPGLGWIELHDAQIITAAHAAIPASLNLCPFRALSPSADGTGVLSLAGSKV